MYSNDIYFLEQNINLTKTSKYYYINYQHIIRELNVEEYQSEEESVIIERRVLDFSTNNNFFYEQKIFYGRINQLQFKLCHEFCQTCYELGTSNNNQKCSSCLPLYLYDYWYYYNNSIDNCVPEGYYKDISKNILWKNQQNKI